MKTALLTGFEPFGGELINPSWEAVRALDGEDINGHRLVARLLPCVFGEALDALNAAIDEVNPQLVVCVGQAGGRDKVCIERFAVNVDRARIPDNRGNRPTGEPIVSGGPERYEAHLPVASIARALRAREVPSKVSLSAGRYVCNHVMYGLLHRIATTNPDLRGGFIHIPYLPEQAARNPKHPPSMELATIVEGLRTAVLSATTS